MASMNTTSTRTSMPPDRYSYTRHDSPKKNRFIGAVSAGLSIAEAANKENIPISTAYHIWNKYKTTSSTHSLPRSGRPPKITERTERQVVREAVRNRREPLASVGQHVKPKISDQAVRRILAAHGYHRRVARRVPYLSKRQKKARLAWARALKGRRWDDIIWSDECYVHIDDKHGRVYVTRRVDKVLHEDCVVPAFTQSNIRVMVWGCIMSGRKGPLIVLEYPGGKGGRMNSSRYQRQVLNGVLQPFFLQEKQRMPSLSFQHDNAPSHSSKSTKRWFIKHGIPLFPHPPSSPDVNPIEPLWHVLKNIIHHRKHPPSSTEELRTAVKEAWDQITDVDVEKHTHTMPERVKAVLDAHGGHTKY